MPTIIEREARLVAFLQGQFPSHRIVPTLQRVDDARRSDIVDTPELRVILEGTSGGASLRWLLQVAEGSAGNAAQRRIGTTGILSTAQRLRAAIANEDDGAIYRIANAKLARHNDSADLWEEILEEAYTPQGRTPQALFAFAAEYGFSPDSFPAGTNDFGAVEPFVDPAQPGASMTAASHGQHWFLGRVLQSTPTLVTEFPLQQPAVAPFFNLVSTGVHAPEAGVEELRFDSSDSEALQVSLAGIRRKKIFAPTREALRLELPQVPRSVIRQWREYLADNNIRPSFMLVRSDFTIVEATVTNVQSRMMDHSGSLSLEMFVSPIANLSPFAES